MADEFIRPGNGGHAEGSYVLIEDSAGRLFSPDSCAHAYSWDGAGNLLTDTATDRQGNIRLKTLTWTGGVLAGETMWVPQ